MNELQKLVDTLEAQDKVKKDFLAPTGSLHFTNGNLFMTHNDVPIKFIPTPVFHSQLATKLEIPKGYYDRMKGRAVELLDENVNHWLRDEGKNVLLRAFVPGDQDNTARALLSDRYNVIDNMEVLLQILDTLKDCGVVINIEQAELSETRMYINVTAPEIEVKANELLKQYRKAIQVGSGIITGFSVQNSEIGYGSFEIMSRLKFLCCNNGATSKKDSLRKIHLGGKLDELEFYKSDAVKNANRKLVKEQVNHAVKKFLSKDYLQQQVDMLTEIGNKKIEAPVNAVIEVIAKDYGFTQEDKASILNCFIDGGDRRRIGIFNAVTEVSQTLQDIDHKHDTEVAGMDILVNFDRIEAAAIKLDRSAN